MKQLQNNFTTPEQSQRLLELGVPAWTANIMFDKNRRRYELIETEDESWAETQRTLFYNGGAIPHWSVGRLIEIFAKCKMYSYEDRTTPLQLYADEINGGLVEFLVDIIYNYNDLDFSKLEN